MLSADQNQDNLLLINMLSHQVPHPDEVVSAANFLFDSLSLTPASNCDTFKLCKCLKAYSHDIGGDDSVWYDLAYSLAYTRHDGYSIITSSWKSPADKAGGYGIIAEAATRGWRFSGTLSSGPLPQLTDAQRKHKQEVQCRYELDRAKKQDEIAEHVAKLLNSFEVYSGVNHAYIHKKGLLSSPVVSTVKAIGHAQAATLLIPYYSNVLNPKITSLQQISVDGVKRFFPGSRTSGCFGFIGDLSSNTIVIAEGWATAASIASTLGGSMCVVYAGSASNVPKIAHEIDRSLLTCRSIILAGEHDKGESAKRCALAVTGLGRCRSSIILPTVGKDFNDMYASGKVIDMVSILMEGIGNLSAPKLPSQIEVIPPPIIPSPIVKASSLTARQEPRYLIKGLLPEQSVSFLVGESQAGKSFASFEIALRLAKGESFSNYKIRRPVPVLYIGLEAVAPTERRLRYLQEVRGLPDNFYYSSAPMNLSDGANIAAWVDNIKAMGIANGLIIIDTFSRAMGDIDENASRDAGIVYQSLEALAKMSNNAVMAVHHYSNKEHARKASKQQMMGSSKFYNNADVVIEVVKTGKLRTVRPTKSRDDELFPLFNYTIDNCIVGIDDDGDNVNVGLLREVSDELEMNMLSMDEVKVTSRPKSDGKQMELLRSCLGGGVECAIDQILEFYVEIYKGSKGDTNTAAFRKYKSVTNKFIKNCIEDGTLIKCVDGNGNLTGKIRLASVDETDT